MPDSRFGDGGTLWHIHALKIKSTLSETTNHNAWDFSRRVGAINIFLQGDTASQSPRDQPRRIFHPQRGRW